MDIVASALAKVLGVPYEPHLSSGKRASANELNVIGVPDRPWTLCAGCPEMGALWIMKEALKVSTLFDRKP